MSNFRITLIAITILGAGCSLAAEHQKEDNSAAQNDAQQISIEETNNNKGIKIKNHTNNTPTDRTCEPIDLRTTNDEEFFEKIREISKTAQVFVPSLDGNYEGPCFIGKTINPMDFAGLK